LPTVHAALKCTVFKYYTKGAYTTHSWSFEVRIMIACNMDTIE